MPARGLLISRLLTGSATRKPRPVGGDKGRNKKQTVSLPGSPALWAGCFQNAHLRRFPHPSSEASGTCGDTLPQGVPRPKGIGTCPRNNASGLRIVSASLRDSAISGALHLDIFEQPAKCLFQQALRPVQPSGRPARYTASGSEGSTRRYAGRTRGPSPLSAPSPPGRGRNCPPSRERRRESPTPGR